MTRDESPSTPPGDEPASPGKKKGKNLLGLVVSVVLALAAPFVGAMVSVLFLNRAFQGTAGVEPSQKAQVLAEGISRAMNGAAFGLVVSFAAVVLAVVFAVRLARARRRA